MINEINIKRNSVTMSFIQKVEVTYITLPLEVPDCERVYFICPSDAKAIASEIFRHLGNLHALLLGEEARLSNRSFLLLCAVDKR